MTNAQMLARNRVLNGLTDEMTIRRLTCSDDFSSDTGTVTPRWAAGSYIISARRIASPVSGWAWRNYTTPTSRYRSISPATTPPAWDLTAAATLDPDRVQNRHATPATGRHCGAAATARPYL
jgi:hypothetical protein